MDTRRQHWWLVGIVNIGSGNGSVPSGIKGWPHVLFYKILCYHNDVIKWNHFRVTGPLCREFTVYRWIPLTQGSDTELWCFLWSAPEQTVWDAGDSKRHRAHYENHTVNTTFSTLLLLLKLIALECPFEASRILPQVFGGVIRHCS